MPCRKGTKQTSQAIIDTIIEEHANGAIRTELAIKYNKLLMITSISIIKKR